MTRPHEGSGGTTPTPTDWLTKDFEMVQRERFELAGVGRWLLGVWGAIVVWALSSNMQGLTTLRDLASRVDGLGYGALAFAMVIFIVDAPILVAAAWPSDTAPPPPGPPGNNEDVVRVAQLAKAITRNQHIRVRCGVGLVLLAGSVTLLALALPRVAEDTRALANIALILILIVLVGIATFVRETHGNPRRRRTFRISAPRDPNR